MVAAQRPWCWIKESRNCNSHRGIGLYRIIACALLVCLLLVLCLSAVSESVCSEIRHGTANCARLGPESSQVQYKTIQDRGPARVLRGRGGKGCVNTGLG